MLRITSSKVFSHAVRAVSSRGSSLTGSMTDAFRGCSVEDYVDAICRHFCTADPHKQNSIVPLAICPTDIVPLAISPSDIVPLAISPTDDEAKKHINGNLLEVLDSEIKLKKTANKTANDADEMPAAIQMPDDFPFTIEENPLEENITLSRDFHGEKIEVYVYMPYIPEYDVVSSSDSETESDGDSDDDSDFSSSSDDSDDDSDDEEKKEEDKPKPLLLMMKVSKQDGEFSKIRFTVSPEEIQMRWVDLHKKSGESSHELLTNYLNKKNMKSAFVEFLKTRGIDTSIYGFLYEYMVNKKKTRPVAVAELEKLKEFYAK